MFSINGQQTFFFFLIEDQIVNISGFVEHTVTGTRKAATESTNGGSALRKLYLQKQLSWTPHELE